MTIFGTVFSHMTPYVSVTVFWPLSHYDSDFWTFMFGTIWFLFDRYLFVVLIVLDTWDSWVYSGLLFHPDICCICINSDLDMVLIWIHIDVYLKNVILLLERWNKIMLFFPRKRKYKCVCYYNNFNSRHSKYYCMCWVSCCNILEDWQHFTSDKKNYYILSVTMLSLLF